MIDRFEILANQLRRLVSRSRWSARIVGERAPRAGSSGPGLVFVQIDGLGESVLEDALASGRMPFLSRLIRRDGHRIRSLYSGLPSSTPAVQAELFYGVRSAVPAFSYRDREAGRVISMNHPSAAQLVEERLKRGRRGLLRGGSSWSNIYAGGAEEAHLCASTTGPGEAFRALAPNRLLGLLLWHFPSALRVLGNLLITNGLVLWDLFRGRLGFRSLVGELRFVPLRVAVDTAMREIITAGAAIDVERGLPVVHVNYLGYDEHAHRRGPRASFALWSLRGIDRSIRRVANAARRSRGRHYQIWVYSDHGQELSEPYAARHGESIESAVARVYARISDREGPRAHGRTEEPGETRTRTRFSWLGLSPARWMVPVSPEPPRARPSTKQPDVAHQGPTALIYLPERHDQRVLGRMAAALVADAHVPVVLVSDGSGSAVAVTSSGRHRLPEEAAAFLGADHPHLDRVSRDLAQLPLHPEAGDLLLVGWNRSAPMTFQGEHGCHGGPGPEETSAFALLPPEIASHVPRGRSIRPVELHDMARAFLRPEEAPPVEPISEPRAMVREEEGGLAVPIRLMTYNVHGCRGMDGIYAPQRIARVIDRERPDVVCLQEVDQERARSGGIDQARVIARQLQTNYYFHAVAEHEPGRFGNAILSRLPMRTVAEGSLPTLPRARRVLRLEARGVLWVALSAGGFYVNLLTTHLGIYPRERSEQVDALLGPSWLGHEACDGVVVLCGDFNASPRSATLRRFEPRLQSAVGAAKRDRALRTWSGRVPLRRIDHVLVNDRVHVTRSHVPRTSLARVASDHLPLVVDLVCRFPGPRERSGDEIGVPEELGT